MTASRCCSAVLPCMPYGPLSCAAHRSVYQPRMAARSCWLVAYPHQGSRNLNHSPVAFRAILPVSIALPARKFAVCLAAHPNEGDICGAVLPWDALGILDARRWRYIVLLR
jgi:hypothetical protein